MAVVKCAQCGKSETYDMKPGYPRKYCHACSEAKKAEFEGKSVAPAPVFAPKAELLSARDISIIAQVVVKCVAYHKPMEVEDAIEAYHQAVAILENNG